MLLALCPISSSQGLAPEAGDLSSELHLYSTKIEPMRENLRIGSVPVKVLKENWSLDLVMVPGCSGQAHECPHR